MLRPPNKSSVPSQFNMYSAILSAYFNSFPVFHFTGPCSPLMPRLSDTHGRGTCRHSQSPAAPGAATHSPSLIPSSIGK